MIPLRPYQLDAVERCRQYTRAARLRLLLVLPTGGGKTVIAAHIISCALDLGNRILFVAHRRELINQAVNKLVAMGIPAEKIGVLMASDKRRNPGAPVQVASIDTLRNRAKPASDLVVIDEAHRSLAKSYVDLVEHYTGAAILGMTATPYRADSKGLGAIYQELVAVSTPGQLIADGFLVEPRVFTVPAAYLPDLGKIKIKGGDYDEVELAKATDQTHLVGNIVEHWVRHAEGRRTVAFSVNVEHSQHIAAQFDAAGIPAEHLDGKTPHDERDAILRRLETGETLVVSNCGVLCEGWDQPSVKCAILARPTKSTGLYLQQAGRILRPWNDIKALILDHSGNVLAHGLPQEEREFTLETTKKRGTKAPPCKTCPECYAVIPGGTLQCPECGHVFETEKNEKKHVDGKLVEVVEATLEDKRKEWDKLCALAIARGYKSGWCWHRYRDKFGVSPPSSFTFPERETPNYSDEDKRAELALLKTLAATRGYHHGWVEKRYRAKFGESVPVDRASVLGVSKAPPPPSTPNDEDLVEWAI